MLFKGNLKRGQDLVVQCRAAGTNQSPVLVTLAEVPRSGQQPRIAHRMVGPAGADEATLSELEGIALRVDIDVVEPESVSVRVLQGSVVKAESIVSRDEKWVFSVAS